MPDWPACATTSPSRASTSTSLRLQRAVQPFGDRAPHADLLLLERLDRELDEQGVARRGAVPRAVGAAGDERPHADGGGDRPEDEAAEHLRVARRVVQCRVHAEQHLREEPRTAATTAATRIAAAIRHRRVARCACTAASTATSISDRHRVRRESRDERDRLPRRGCRWRRRRSTAVRHRSRSPGRTTAVARSRATCGLRAGRRDGCEGSGGVGRRRRHPCSSLVGDRDVLAAVRARTARRTQPQTILAAMSDPSTRPVARRRRRGPAAVPLDARAHPRRNPRAPGGRGGRHGRPRRHACCARAWSTA